MEPITIQKQTLASTGLVLTFALMMPSLAAGKGCQLLQRPARPQHTARVMRSVSALVPLQKYIITHSASTGSLHKIGSHGGLRITDAPTHSGMGPQ